MALLVSMQINGDAPLGMLNIHNLGGDFDGVCDYEVTVLGLEGGYATFQHSRPRGALVCLRKALEALEGGLE
jgi:hypothetical protein